MRHRASRVLGSTSPLASIKRTTLAVLLSATALQISLHKACWPVKDAEDLRAVRSVERSVEDGRAASKDDEDLWAVAEDGRSVEEGRAAAEDAEDLRAVAEDGTGSRLFVSHG